MENHDDGYTPMRPLVMDFRDDVRAQNIGDQFMFGPAFLVNPVTEPGGNQRRLYLPKRDGTTSGLVTSVEGGRR